MAALTTFPAAPLVGAATVPGDKSISHRAMILAAMAPGESIVRGLAQSDDVMRTVTAVRMLGAAVRQDGDLWRVRGGPWRAPAAPIDCGNSGTTARLLMGAVAGQPIATRLTGDESLRRRPMARVAAPLRHMGALVDRDTLPLLVRGGGLGGIDHGSPVASAQVKSAILLAGLNTGAAVAVTEWRQSRDHSERLLRAFGCDVTVNETRVQLGPRRALQAADVMVPGDPSSAAFLLAAALVVPASAVTIRSMMMNRLRTGFIEVLLAMGGDLRVANRRAVGGEEVADVTARASRLNAVEVAADLVPATVDEIPILAVAAAFAKGETVMRGLGELRLKESDRLSAIVQGLTRCGVSARCEGDDLHVLGGTAPQGGAVDSRGDHRIAMSFLVLGLAAAGPVTVDATEMIATSFPGFAETLRSLGARIEPA